MGWKQVGGDARFSIYAWVPDLEETPPGDDPGVGGMSTDCEFGLVFPCRDADKQPARWMLQWQECNCDGPNEPQAVCAHCFTWLVDHLDAKPYSQCDGCDLFYAPGRAIIRDLVALP